MISSAISDALPIIMGAIGLIGGLAAAVVGFMKVKPENTQVLVSAAEDVVLIQKGMVDQLRQEVLHLHEDNAILHQDAKMMTMRLAELQRANDRLYRRVTELENGVNEVKNGNGNGHNGHTPPTEG